MVVWTGKGWLVLALFLLCGIAPTWVGIALGTDYVHRHSWPAGVGEMIAGVAVLLIGLAVNRGRPRHAAGPGGPFRSRPDHSFMLVRMEYWAPVLFAAGIVFCVV